VHQQQVDVIGPEPLQALLADPLDRGVAAVELGRVSDRVPGDPDLADQDNVVAAPLQGTPEHLLRAAEAVVRGRVEQGHAELHRAMDGGDDLVVLGAAVARVPHLPAAEPDRRHGQARVS
jgi:hypothetical protein